MTNRGRTSTRAIRSLTIVGVIAATVLVCERSERSSAPVRPDVFLITVDTMRADRLGTYGSGRELTPRLDALANESLVFEQAYAPAPFTVPSVSSLLTGRHPMVTGVTSNLGIVPDVVPTLAEVLQEAGWKTGAVVSSFALRRATGLHRGFDTYDDRLNRSERNRKLPERIASDTRAAAIALLDEMIAARSDPIFLWVHFQDPHGPYTPPSEYREPLLDAARAEPDGRRRLRVSRDLSGIGGIPSYQVLGSEREAGFYRASYDGEIAYTDVEIGLLIDGIRARGRFDDAIVVFATDHGESLGEDDYWFAHGETLSDGLMRVPLMIRAPGIDPGRRGDLASLLDVRPTLLSWLSIEQSEGEGRDLFAPETEPRALILSTLEGSKPSHLALLTEGEKYVVTSVAEGRRESLHLLGDESRDLAPENPERVAELRAEFEAIRDRLPPRIGARRQSLSDIEKARLRALGYATDE